MDLTLSEGDKIGCDSVVMEVSRLYVHYIVVSGWKDSIVGIVIKWESSVGSSWLSKVYSDGIQSINGSKGASLITFLFCSIVFSNDCSTEGKLKQLVYPVSEIFAVGTWIGDVRGEGSLGNILCLM